MPLLLPPKSEKLDQLLKLPCTPQSHLTSKPIQQHKTIILLTLKPN